MLWSPARLTGDRQRHRKEVCESMTGAMYAAIGGLKSHMTKLNVIGNNVANVNTHGYKAQRMTFKESMYTTSRSGSNGGVTMGGNNPSQIGYGCSVGSIDLNMSPSTYAPTGVGLDCMLDGEGFFMVGDKLEYDEINKVWTGGITKGSEVSQMDLTRVGDFWVDPDGYICNRDNKVVYGFARVQNPAYDPTKKKPDAGASKEEMDAYELSQKETIISTHLVPLRVPLSAAAPTKENEGIAANGDHVWEEGDPVYPFLSATAGGTNQYGTPGVYTKYSEALKANQDASNAAGGAGGGTNTAKPQTLYPVAKNTNENAVSDVMPVQLKNMQIGTDGSIYGVAANGDTVIVGYIAVASADSPDGVTHIDGPYYKAMGGAGNLRVSTLVELPTSYLGNQVATEATGTTAATTPDANDAILTEKTTKVRNGGLEASSTDVANEFAEMITTQRGYQANTRIITVTDSMLEELVNMKR